jgi:hypothetical protein
VAVLLPGGQEITADDVLDHVLAPIIYWVIFLPWTLSDTTAADFVDGLFRR